MHQFHTVRKTRKGQYHNKGFYDPRTVWQGDKGAVHMPKILIIKAYSANLILSAIYFKEAVGQFSINFVAWWMTKLALRLKGVKNRKGSTKWRFKQCSLFRYLRQNSQMKMHGTDVSSNGYGEKYHGLILLRPI